TSSPSCKHVPGWTADQSRPSSVTFSPSAPGTSGWPSSCSSRIASIANRQTARSGPPWCSPSRCASPSRPSGVILAIGPARLGTPPFETLSCTMRPTSLTTSPPLDHPLHPCLAHQPVALIPDAVAVANDAAVRLLRLTLVVHLHLHADRLAHAHRP